MLNFANCTKSQRDSMAPTRLIRDINRILKTSPEIPENYRDMLIDKWDISKNWNKICIFFILRWIHPEIVEWLINYSVQNWYEWWIDVFAKMPGQHKTLLEYSIEACNYRIFNQILILNKPQVYKINCIDNILFTTVKTTSEIAIRKQMLAECLKLGFELSKETVKKLILTKNTDYLHIIAESEAWKKILTEDFLRKLDKILQLELANTRKIQEILRLIRNRVCVINPSLIDSDSSDPYFDMDNAGTTFPEIKNLDTLWLDVSTRVIQLTRK